MSKSISINLLFTVLLLGAAPFPAFAQVATYVPDLSKENEADLLQDLKWAEEEFGPEHRALVPRLKALGRFYRGARRYPEEISSRERALAILEKTSGPDSLDVVGTLWTLKNVYEQQGEFDNAEAASKRELQITEKIGGFERIPGIVRNLALHYVHRGDYAQAEVYANRLLTLWEQSRYIESAEADACSILSDIYRELGRYTEAEEFWRRDRSNRQTQAGSRKIALADTALARIYFASGRYAEAEQIYKEILRRDEEGARRKQADVGDAYILFGLAEVYRAQGKQDQAEPLYKQAIAIYEEKAHRVWPSSPEVGQVYAGYAELKAAQGRYEQAEELFEKALTALERAAPVHKIPVLQSYASMLRKAGRDTKAEETEARIRTFEEESNQ